MIDKYADIRECLAKITPGQWEYFQRENIVVANDVNFKYVDIADNICITYDGEFIANAPKYVRMLLDRVEQLEKVDEERVKVLTATKGLITEYRQVNDRFKKALEEIASDVEGLPYKSYSALLARKVLERSE